MRPTNRIHNFLRLLEEEWLKFPDLRFTQFLFNHGISDMHKLHYMEEHDVLRKYFQNISPREYVLWETFGKSGNEPSKFVLIKDMSDEHIKAVLETQVHISERLKLDFIRELKLREDKSELSIKE